MNPGGALCGPHGLGFVSATLHKPWRERPRRTCARVTLRAELGVAHARVCLSVFVRLECRTKHLLVSHHPSSSVVGFLTSSSAITTSIVALCSPRSRPRCCAPTAPRLRALARVCAQRTRREHLCDGQEETFQG